MKKNSLFLFVIIGATLTQGCKKDKDDDTTDTTVTPVFQAYIGTPVWAPDTVSASITYNTTTKTKVFSCGGVKAQKQIEIALTDPTPGDNNGLTLGTYKVNESADLLFTYSTQKKDAGGNYVFEPYGTVKPNSGTLVISAIDTVNKTITGTFNFVSSKTNYDENGNIISVDLAAISAGTIQAMPYTFKRE